MSLTSDLAFNTGYFDQPEDNSNIDFAGYAEWASHLEDDGDCCAICFADYARPMSGLCPSCEHNEGDALERDLTETYA